AGSRPRARGLPRGQEEAGAGGVGWAPPPAAARPEALAGGGAASPRRRRRGRSRLGAAVGRRASRPGTLTGAAQPGPTGGGAASPRSRLDCSARCWHGWPQAGPARSSSADERAAWSETGVRRLVPKLKRMIGGMWTRLNTVNLRIDAGLIVVIDPGICWCCN
ncbi:hypothetical protein PVAP13_4KG176781, partial [Panicum virgatum]